MAAPAEACRCWPIHFQNLQVSLSCLVIEAGWDARCRFRQWPMGLGEVHGGFGSLLSHGHQTQGPGWTRLDWFGPIELPHTGSGGCVVPAERPVRASVATGTFRKELADGRW